MKALQRIDAWCRAGAPLALLAIGVVAQFGFVHIDDLDSALYRTLARNISIDGEWTHLKAVPGYFSPFYEHPPFYFIFLAGFMSTLGFASVPWVCALVGCAIAYVVFRFGVAFVGRRSALFAVLVLGTTEAIVRKLSLPRLDAPLTLAFSAAVACLVLARGRWTYLVAGGLATAVGALVKGPPAFGAPFAAALMLLVVGRGSELRSPKPWIIVGIVALTPPLLFMVYDHYALGGAWYSGYIEQQFLASVTGSRTDGSTSRFFLLQKIGSRFWPGLPFALLAVVLGARRRDRKRLALVLWAGVIVGGFMSAARAWPHYNLPAFVPLALLAGCGINDLLTRYDPNQRAYAIMNRAAFVTAVILVATAPLGLLQRTFRTPYYGDLGRRAAKVVRPDEVITIVHSGKTKRALLYLANDSDRYVRVVTSSSSPAVTDATALIVNAEHWPIEGWTAHARHGAWTLALPAPKEVRPE